MFHTAVFRPSSDATIFRQRFGGPNETMFLDKLLIKNALDQITSTIRRHYDSEARKMQLEMDSIELEISCANTILITMLMD